MSSSKRAYDREYYRTHKVERRAYRDLNKQRIKTYDRERYLARQQEEKERQKKYRESHKEETRARRKAYYESHKQQEADYTRNKRRTSISFRLRCSLANRIKDSLKRGCKKSFVSEVLLGASVEFVRGYLEAKFLPGMSWENYGDWHIDHIRPCARFDLSDPEQQKLCFHYSNLQPLWAADNLSKGDKWAA